MTDCGWLADAVYPMDHVQMRKASVEALKKVGEDSNVYYLSKVAGHGVTDHNPTEQKECSTADNNAEMKRRQQRATNTESDWSRKTRSNKRIDSYKDRPVPNAHINNKHRSGKELSNYWSTTQTEREAHGRCLQ